jgi:hypothetical protein
MGIRARLPVRMVRCHPGMVTGSQCHRRHLHHLPHNVMIPGVNRSTVVKATTAPEVALLPRTAVIIPWLAPTSSQTSLLATSKKRARNHLPSPAATVLSIESEVTRMLIMATRSPANRTTIRSASADHKSNPPTGEQPLPLPNKE